MEYLKRRQKTRQRLYSKVTLFALAILLVVLIRPTWKIYEKSIESRKNLDKAEQRKIELENDTEYIKSDYGRDQEIRDKFGYAKEGETMVVIVRPEEKAPPPPEPERKSFISRLWSGFVSIFTLD